MLAGFWPVGETQRRPAPARSCGRFNFLLGAVKELKCSLPLRRPLFIGRRGNWFQNDLLLVMMKASRDSQCGSDHKGKGN
jgi:hypothetical protein